MLRKLTHRTLSSQRNTKRIGSCREYNRHESRTLHITAQFLHNQPVQSQYFPRLFRHSHVVGYQQINLVKGANLLSVSWESVGKDGKAYLLDIMETSKLVSINENGDALSGDYINTWDQSKGGWGAPYQYCARPDWNDPEAPEYDYTDCWMDQDGLPANPEMHPGEAFWLFLKNPITGLNFNGQVASTGGAITLVAGANLLANTKPATLDLSDKDQVVIGGNKTSINENGDALSGDYINTWSLVKGGWGAPYQYCARPDWNDPEAPEYDYSDCWMDQEGLPASTDIPSGTGFWYFAKQAGVTIIFQ